jgi:cobalt-zinc-cadmium efflux system outer membrane protein
MMRLRPILPLLPLGLLLAACVSVPQDGEFGDVATAVEERLHKEVTWTQSKEEADTADGAVAALLAKDLTADAAVQIAVLNNRSLQATYADLGIAQAAFVQAGLLRNPIFDAVFRFPEEGGSVNLDLGVVFEFLDILAIPLRQRVAESEFETVKLRVTGEVIDVAAATRIAFREHQSQQQVLGLFRQVAASSEASLEAAQTLHDAGNITDLDLANERFLAAQAKLSFAEAEAQVVAGRERLNVLMGLWGAETAWRIAQRLPNVPREALDLERIEREAISRSIDLAIARQELITLGRRYGVTKVTSLVPEFEVGAEAERDDREWSIGPAVALPIPLFDQGQAQRASARAAVLKAQESYAWLAVRIRSAARVERARLLKARQTVQYYRKHILPLTKQILDQTLLEYNAMQIGVFRLIDAKQQQITAGQRYIGALRDYWIARARVEQLLDGRLPTQAVGASAMTESALAQPNEGGH